LHVVFCLVPSFLDATIRHFAFMLTGLQEVESELIKLHIPFTLLTGNPEDEIPEFASRITAGTVVTDFNPLRIAMRWRSQVASRLTVPLIEVDAHNILPARLITDKPEYAAFTLRKKIEANLPQWLQPIPEIIPHPFNIRDENVKAIDWEFTLNRLPVDRSVQEVSGIIPGEKAALEGLNLFVKKKLENYSTERNFPDKAGQSELSPWLHFGQISAQRVALEVSSAYANPESRASFLEELIVRRELADNFCLHTPDYDRFDGFQPWAKKTLDKHRADIREYIYEAEEFEACRTHDPLWNSAQREMMVKGKMHGYMRMYWAKKILEWSESPEAAMAIAIWLNDKYELDGRDPNGYAGIAWAIGGVHDRPWAERPVFGMIRYMNYQGCKRKFDVSSYQRLCAAL
jgi:deoxyribodipyrimidine photo-lyase